MNDIETNLTSLDDVEFLSANTMISLLSGNSDDDIQNNYHIAQSIARKRKIMREFEATYKRYKNKKLAVQINDNVTNFTGQPFPLRCGAWIAEDVGIERVAERDGRSISLKAAAHPIMPTEIMVNIEDRTEKIRLWYVSNKPHTVVVNRSTIASNVKIIELSDIGVSVSSDNSKELVKYLQCCIDLNGDIIPRTISTSSLGWYNKKFIPYDDDIGFDGEESNRAIFDALHTQGNREEWLNYMRGLRANKQFRLVMAASFAAPLVSILNLNSFILHLYGTTSTAKTVALMCAASVWGDPRKGGIWNALNGTNNSICSTLGFLKNLPMLSDELQTIRDKIGYDKLIMQSTEGIDRLRNRFDKTIRPKTWATCCIFNGEDPILQSNSGGGTVNRVIQIETTAPLVSDGKSTVDFILQNYGYAGREYIKLLQNTTTVTLNEMFKNFYDDIMSLGVTTDKQAQNAACLLTADYISSELIFNDGSGALTVQDISGYLTPAEDVDIALRAADYIRGWMATNANKIYNCATDIIPAGDIYGVYDVQGAYILKNVLTKALSDAGYDYNAVKKRWASAGFLIMQKDRYDYRKGICGQAPICVLLKRE